MKPHLIVLDLDGTLLTDEKVISDKTANLKKAEEQGHHVMIATGRPYRASEVYYHQLGLKDTDCQFQRRIRPSSWRSIMENDP